MTNATTTAVDLKDCVSFRLRQNDLVTYIYNFQILFHYMLL